MKTQRTKCMGCCKSSSKRNVYSYTGLPQETGKKQQQQINDLTLHLKELLREGKQNKTKTPPQK